MSDTESVLQQALDWHKAGLNVALATVVTTWGSSPRPVGSKLAADAQGRFVGSVSGGCVEGAVVEAAAEVMRSGTPQLLDFGVTDEQAWEVGLACGGKVQILVEPLSVRRHQRPPADDIRIPIAFTTLLPGGKRPPQKDDSGLEDHQVDVLSLPADDIAQVRAAIREDKSRVIETSIGKVFVEVWNPPLRLVVIGAVHIAQTLAPMAALAGYKVTVIDPRSAVASAERFPGVAIVADWPDDVLPGLQPDKRTAIVTLTHDPKIDDPALQAALGSDAFYIGALGSRKTHAKRGERLAEAGFDASQIQRIRGPVGLAIGALTPAEIAIAILAEITAVLHRASLAERAA